MSMRSSEDPRDLIELPQNKLTFEEMLERAIGQNDGQGKAMKKSNS